MTHLCGKTSFVLTVIVVSVSGDANPKQLVLCYTRTSDLAVL